MKSKTTSSPPAWYRRTLVANAKSRRFHSKADHVNDILPEKKHRWIPAVATMLTLLIMVVSGYSLFIWLNVITELPPTKPSNQAAFVFVGEQNAPLHVEIGFSEENRGTNEITFHLTVPDDYVSNDLDFQILLKGEGFASHKIPSDNDSGCAVDAYGVPGPVSCKMVNVAEGGISFGFEGPSQLLQGKLVRNDTGNMWANVYLPLKEQNWSMTSGSGMSFALPKVGTIYLPDSLMNQSFNIGTQKKAYVPNVTTLVDYRGLERTERVQNASPPLQRSDTLTWIRTGSGTISATGLLTRIDLEVKSNNMLLIISVLFGFILGSMPFLNRFLKMLLIHCFNSYKK